MKVIGVIEDPAVIKRILIHRDNCESAGQRREHPTRALPQRGLPGLMESAADSETNTDARLHSASA